MMDAAVMLEKSPIQAVKNVTIKINPSDCISKKAILNNHVLMESELSFTNFFMLLVSS